MTGADRLRLVAAREVRERLRARSFQITTVVLALAVVAAIVLPSLGDGDPPTVKVGHPGAPTAARRDAVAAAGRLAGVRVEPVAVPDRGAAERALGAGDVDLAVLDGPELVVKARPEEDSELARFAAAVSQSLGVQARLEQAGLSPEVASAAREAQPLPLRSLDPPDPERQRQAGPLGFMAAIVLFLMLLQYGGWILYGVVEEKSSRVVEVVLAAVRPTQLLAGKVLGIGAVAVGQGLLLAVTALVTVWAVGADHLPDGTPATTAAALLWFVIGFALYSFAFATLGSLASRQRGRPERLVPAHRGHDVRIPGGDGGRLQPGRAAVAGPVVRAHHGAVRHAGARRCRGGRLGGGTGRRAVRRHRRPHRPPGRLRVLAGGPSRRSPPQAAPGVEGPAGMNPGPDRARRYPGPMPLCAPTSSHRPSARPCP